MNDSKDFQDAESIRSGNSHVTSPPGVFPKHPPFEGLLKPAFISQRQDEEPPNAWDTSSISGNVLAHPQASSSAPYPQELNSSKWNTWSADVLRVQKDIGSGPGARWTNRVRVSMQARLVKGPTDHLRLASADEDLSRRSARSSGADAKRISDGCS